MKFLNKDGEVMEGEPLTDKQLSQREMIVNFVHQKVCGGSYHSAWNRKNTTVACEQIANFFVTKFTLTRLPGTDMESEIALAAEENAPKHLEAPPAPAPVEIDKEAFLAL